MKIHEPDLSRRMAMAVQGMTPELRKRFIEACKRASSEADLPPAYRSYLKKGYKPDKVISTLQGEK